jgi:hypothetical protein
MRLVRVALMALTLVIVAAGCSSRGGKGSPASASRPEDRRASATEVAAGLRQIATISAGIADAAGTDKAKAEALDARIEPVWKTIEGTVKANDPDTYLTFEDSFAVLAKAADEADATKARQAAETVAKTVDSYLGKYPG